MTPNSPLATELISEAIDPIYPNLDVDPNFHEKADIYQMWTFEDKGDDLHLPESLSDKLRMVRWHEHSSDIVPISGSKATGVGKGCGTSRLETRECHGLWGWSQ